ncbi:MAG: hypothetical protein U0Q16_20010 [Bryobacteraceae bacterium]
MRPLCCAAILLSIHAAAQIRVQPLLDLEGETSEPHLSPDGNTLAFQWCKSDSTCAIYTRPLNGGEARLLASRESKGGLPADPRWSPNGKQVAFARVYSHYDVHLFIRDLDTQRERDMGEVCHLESHGQWTPGGRYLIVSVPAEDPGTLSRCRVRLVSSETGKLIRELAPRGSISALSPDGRKLAYSDGATLLLLPLTADFRPAAPASVIAREPRDISRILWTLEGKQILYQVWGDVPYLRRITPGPSARPEPIPGLDNEFSPAQFLPDGKLLATETTKPAALWRVDITSTSAKLESVSGKTCSSGASGCSPDGRLRVFVDVRSGISEIWLANGAGTNGRPLVKSIPGFLSPQDDGVPRLAGWSPDIKWIAFTVAPVRGNADFRSDLYVVPSSGGTPRRLGKEAYALNFPAWSADSKSLYAAQGWSIFDRARESKSPLVRIDLSSGGITQMGVDGMWPRPSQDGKFVYFFTRTRSKLSRIPVNGGPTEQLWDKDDLLPYYAAIGARALYLVQKTLAGAHDHRLLRFDPDSRKATLLAEVPFGPRALYWSPGENALYLQQEGDSKRRVVLVEGLF